MATRSRWRVAVTTETTGGALPAALERAGFAPVTCLLTREAPVLDPARLLEVARRLDDYDWIVCASTRSVRHLTEARGTAWPPRPRTAAVGPATALALSAAGAGDPVVAHPAGAAALWACLKPLDQWPGRRVLVATVAGGRRDLIDGLRAAGAAVDEVETYRMLPRESADIRNEWASIDADAVILGSPSAARLLVDAVGPSPLLALQAIVAIGDSTAGTLADLGVTAATADRATFEAAVDRLAAIHRDRLMR